MFITLKAGDKIRRLSKDIKTGELAYKVRNLTFF